MKKQLGYIGSICILLMVAGCGSDGATEDSGSVGTDAGNEGGTSTASDDDVIETPGPNDSDTPAASTEPLGPCIDGEKMCSGDVVQICAGGEWKGWDDCTVSGQSCRVVKGIYQCVAVNDISAGGDTASQEGSDAGVDTDTGTSPWQYNPDSATITDTGIVTDTGIITDTGVITDTGIVTDTGIITDTGVIIDTGVVVDTGSDVRDTSVDTTSAEGTCQYTCRSTCSSAGGHVMPGICATPGQFCCDDSNVRDTATVACNGGFSLHDGGYVCAGAIHGYAWASPGDVSGSEINPEDFEGLSAGDTRLCVTGVAVADESFRSVGIMGINAGQEYDSNESGAWTGAAQYSGIYVNITKIRASTVRFQVKTASGGEYCMSLDDGVNTIAWDDLTESCWEVGNDSYDPKEPIESVMLLVPGDNEDNIVYDFCLNEMYPFGDPQDIEPDTEDTYSCQHSCVDSCSALNGTYMSGSCPQGTICCDTGATGESCNGGFDILDSGYICAGPWHGYPWTNHGNVDAGGEIEPEDFSAVDTTATEICVQGNTGLDYNSMGILGVSVNQVSGSSSGEWADASSYSGVHVQVDKQGAFALRFWVSTSQNDHYCVDVDDGANTIMWEDLTEDCWESGGETYNGIDGIEDVSLAVPGDETAEIDFAFCLQYLDVW